MESVEFKEAQRKPHAPTTNSLRRCSSNLAEPLSRKQKRESSNLSIASILRACSSVEQEHLSSKQKVAGSSPAKPANSFMLRSSSVDKSVGLINQRLRVQLPPPQPSVYVGL